jgi:hypothetical protein
MGGARGTYWGEEISHRILVVKTEEKEHLENLGVEG